MEVLTECKNIPPEYSLSFSDDDFGDVFGGPPRRFSMPEVREGRASPPWGGQLKEKPVFGEESAARRRHRTGDDFFDDIFGGDHESYGSPMRTNSLFGSSPASAIMSPAARPKTEPFAASLPAHFSLPAKLTKVAEYPTFASRDHSQYKMHSSTNALFSSLRSSSASGSRFSNQAIVGDQDEIKTELHTVYRQSPLSHQASSSSEDSSNKVTSSQKDNVVQRNLKRGTQSVGRNGYNFHFSIYNWAGRGAPIIASLVGRKILKSKDFSRFDKCASSNGRMESEQSTMMNEDLFANIKHESLRTQREMKDSRNKEEKKEVKYSIGEAIFGISSSKPRRNSKDSVVVYCGARQDMKASVGEKTEKEVRMKIEEPSKSEKKLLRQLLTQETEESEKIAEIKENKTSAPKNAKRKEGKSIDSNRADSDKSSLEFVQFFNGEVYSRPKADVQTRRTKNCRWKATAINQKEDAAKVNEIQIKDEARQCIHPKTLTYTSNDFATNQKTAYSSESFCSDTKVSVENLDDPIEDNFQVQELSDDLENVTEIGEGSEDIKALEAKIRQWAVGKKGNIRSLLSTLQYVLWPGSGWKPIPLVDLIEASSVKRAYQRALLQLHPDKLQQKGAASHQKYIAEKVFDILQETWDHFNIVAALLTM